MSDDKYETPNNAHEVLSVGLMGGTLFENGEPTEREKQMLELLDSIQQKLNNVMGILEAKIGFNLDLRGEQLKQVYDIIRDVQSDIG